MQDYNAYLTKQLQKYEIFDNVQEALESDEFVNTHLMPSILDIHGNFLRQACKYFFCPD